MTDSAKISWIYCNACKRNTRHTLVATSEYDYRAGVEDGEPAEWGEYRLWACAGCATCSMEDHYTADYMISRRRGDNGTDEYDQFYSSAFYPERAATSRPNKYFENLPSKLKILYSEVIKSNNDGLHLLCAVGLRSLLEGVCADKGVAGPNLQDKIDGMKALLPENIVKNLHEFRFMGNKAVHELEAPKNFELSLALDVIEDILNFLYALDYKASLLGKTRAAQAEAAAQPAGPAPPGPAPAAQAPPPAGAGKE